MNYFLFVISAFLLGFIAAIPAGPIQIEVVRRSINGHLKASLMVILGAFVSDVIYGSIAFFGITPFLRERMVMAVFWLGGSLILIFLGVLTIRNTLRPGDPDSQSKYLVKKRWSFLGGLSLSGTNPMMILWWLLGARIFVDIGLIDVFTHRIALFFLLAGSLGLAAYLALLSLFISWAKRFISTKGMRRINLGFGIVLILLAGYFIFTSIRYFLNPG
ncbi:MAG: LysE family transporter [Nitrospiraceae bacterium]|nr:LysE family transporter [Nitrospiraceae bacterium]